jgi:hypothetical protein
VLLSLHDYRRATASPLVGQALDWVKLKCLFRPCSIATASLTGTFGTRKIRRHPLRGLPVGWLFVPSSCVAFLWVSVVQCG